MRPEYIQLKTDRHSRVVNHILGEAFNAVNPYGCVRDAVEWDKETLKITHQEIQLKDFKRLFLVGIGKAAIPMAAALHSVLGDRIDSGFLISKYDISEYSRRLPQSIQVVYGSHPIPTQKSVESAKRMLEFVQKKRKDDLVIALVSGGGSSLMTLPQENISLTDYQEISEQLLLAGANIHEINTVRKHIDQLKGGGLLRKAWPAHMITLVLSDVIGDDLDVIASGPTVPDPSTFQDALDVLRKYRFDKKLPDSVLGYLKDGNAGLFKETLKQDSRDIANSKTLIVGSLLIAAEAARRATEKAGFMTQIMSVTLQGEARDVGRELAEQLRLMAEGKHALRRPSCLIAGGETTVTVVGRGKGGRNQETALSAAREISGLPDCLFVSIATDGEDGPTDAAGAAVTGNTCQLGLEQGLRIEDYLAENNAYEYLQQTGVLIITGPTGTNVNDLILMFAF